MGVIARLRSLFRRGQQPSPAAAEAIVDQLIGHGFLKFVATAERDGVRAQLIESVRNNYLDSEWDADCVSADRRSYSADAEELAEGGVGDCLRRMSTVLSAEGVPLEGIHDLFTNEHRRYELHVNDSIHLIYDLNEISMEDIWLVSFRKLLQVTNSMLDEAGSNERLFGIAGGNDARVLFLTESMNALLRENADTFDAGWLPKTAGDLQ